MPWAFRSRVRAAASTGSVRAVLVVASGLLACGFSNGALAQAHGGDAPHQASEEPPAYREVVAAALAEHEAGHFEEARTLMSRAHAMFPNARTLRGLGMVAFELRSYAESVNWLEQALASPVRPLTGELRAQTQALLERARSFTGRITVELSPTQAHLSIDGLEVVTADRAPRRLNVGEHTVEAHAESYLPMRRTIQVVGGEDQTLKVALAPVALASGPVRSESERVGSAPAAPAAADERRPWFRNPWFWVSTGVVLVAGAATGTALALSHKETPREEPYLGLSGERPLTGPSR